MTTISRGHKAQTPALSGLSLAARGAKPASAVKLQVPGQGDRFERPQRALVNLASSQSSSVAVPVSNHAILSSPNQDRAASTFDSLAAIARQSPQAGQRLTPELRDALVLGVNNPRTSSQNGQEGILGQRQAEQAARALVAMPQAQYDQLKSLLSQAGKGPSGQPAPGADAAAERALILKAVAARSTALSSSAPGGTAAAEALQQIQGFANEVRGLNRTELIRTTSVLDLEETINTSMVDPGNPLSADDQITNNDGLFQRFRDSCVPTGSQIVRAEADPIYARSLHTAGLDDQSISSPITQEQARVLEKVRISTRGHIEVQLSQLTPEERATYESTNKLPDRYSAVQGQARSRLGIDAESKLNTLLPRGSTVSRPGQPTPDQTAAIRQYMSGADLSAQQQSAMDAGLAVLRGSNDGFPTQVQLEAVRANATRPSGVGMIYHHALNELASPVTNMQYRSMNGLTPARLQQMEQLLRSGQDVPVTVSSSGPQRNGSHAMVFTDVRGSGDNRSFQLADPWSGRNAWIPEKDLLDRNSDLLSREFGIDWTTVYSLYM